MSENPLSRSELFRRLDGIYAKLPCPVLFVRKNLSPFYFNAAAFLYYPSLCKNGLAPFVEKNDDFADSVVCLEGNSRSPFDRYVLCPVSLRNASVYRVQVLSDSASADRQSRFFRRDFRIEASCDAASREIRRLSGMIRRLKKGSGDFASAEASLAALRQTVSCIRGEICGGDEPECECFDPLLLLRAAEEQLSCLSVSDRREALFSVLSDRTAFLRSVLLACSCLLRPDGGKKKISCVLSSEREAVLVSLLRSSAGTVPSIPDALLAQCEQAVLGAGGTMTFALSEERLEISLRFPGRCYTPADFALSEDDVWETLEECQDLFGSLQSLIRRERPRDDGLLQKNEL